MRILSGAGALALGPNRAIDYTEHLRTADISVGTYSLPAGAVDTQDPHAEDEIYVVVAGRARFVSDDGEAPVGPGDVIFVPAHEVHRFADITEDLSVLVIFGPAEGTRT
jgi:mannose-6-phosphate isomerase-like protein (cupin superfamily)